MGGKSFNFQALKHLEHCARMTLPPLSQSERRERELRCLIAGVKVQQAAANITEPFSVAH